MRVRGYRWPSIVLVHLPAAALGRAWNRLAAALNRPLFDTANLRRMRDLHDRAGTGDGPLFYVIVMPGMLHYLLPCLALVPPTVRVALVANGAARWELAWLARRHPDWPRAAMRRLPGSSLPHGDMLDLMLRATPTPFGILDHDMYVFAPALFQGLGFAEGECLLGIFGDRGGRSGLAYPHTHFLVLNAPVLRDLMRRHRVDARLVRRAPERLQPLLDSIGLFPGVRLKDYHDFFDTLHLLLALAYAEGRRIRFIEPDDPQDVFHVGGTSIGTHQTKELDDIYSHAAFLELSASPELRRRYAHRIAPFASARDIAARMPESMRHARDVTDRLVARLRERGSA